MTKDSEGVPSEVFGPAYELKAEVWPATERRQIETYGDRITGISNARIEGKYEMASRSIVFADGRTLSPGDGICVNVGNTDAPDYRVLTITPYKPVRLEIERT